MFILCVCVSERENDKENLILPISHTPDHVHTMCVCVSEIKRRREKEIEKERKNI